MYPLKRTITITLGVWGRVIYIIRHSTASLMSVRDNCCLPINYSTCCTMLTLVNIFVDAWRKPASIMVIRTINWRYRFWRVVTTAVIENWFLFVAHKSSMHVAYLECNFVSTLKTYLQYTCRWVSLQWSNLNGINSLRINNSNSPLFY